MRSFHLLIAAFALVQVVRYARSFVVFVRPSLRVTGEPGLEPASPARLRVATELRALGFEPLGIVHAVGPLGAERREVDAYASVASGVYADVVQRRSADRADVELFTPFPDGAAVLTSTAPRRALATERAQIGAMRDATLGATLAAHRKAVERFTQAHGAPEVVADLERRVAAGRSWYRGEGGRDLRRSHLTGFLVAVIGLALFASSARLLLAGASPP